MFLNKKKKEIFLFFLIFLILFAHIYTVKSKSVSMPFVNIDCILKKDGSVEITEKRTISFDGDFTYGYYELPKAKSGDLTDFLIADESITYQYDSMGSKMPGTYYREDLGDTWKYYYYFQTSNTTKTFTIRYILKNVILLYEDYGQFFHQLQGTGWNYSIGSFTGKIHWQTPVSMDDYRIWAHGPLWGEFTKTDEYSADLLVTDLPAATMVEVRVLLPRSFFSIQPNHQGNILDSAVTEETKWAVEANVVREDTIEKDKENESVRDYTTENETIQENSNNEQEKKNQDLSKINQPETANNQNNRFLIIIIIAMLTLLLIAILIIWKKSNSKIEYIDKSDHIW